MIATIRGRVIDIETDRVVIEMGGIGVWVYIPDSLRFGLKTGETVSFHTHLVVREDSLTLYGFSSAEERQYFVLLMGVSGVGPRLALTTLSNVNPPAIRRAVFSEQAAIFQRVPGVGAKTAQRILLHLQGRIEAADDLEGLGTLADTDSQVIEALTAMGYSIVEAQASVQMIRKDAPDDVEERIRLALQYFA